MTYELHDRIPVRDLDSIGLARTGALHDPERQRHLKWLYGFLIASFLLQVALVPAFLFPARTLLRAGLFGVSIAMLVAPLGTRRRLPVTYGALAALLLICLGIFHPSTNSVVAGVAALALNVSIIAPVFWASRLRLDARGLEGVLMLIWAFQFASSIFGVLEVMQPGRFSRESSAATEFLGAYAEGLKVTLADGSRIYRPMGLTDSPGGASRSGFFAVLLGSYFLSKHRRLRFKVLCLAGIAAGLFCIYLSQVRSILVLTAVCEIVMVGMFVLRGEMTRAVSLTMALIAMGAIATTWAFAVGGSSVSNRIKTLAEGSAASVYYTNRGIFLEDAIFEHLPTYPMGAGLGRWGMINVYFGDKTGRATPPLYVEIQSSAWIFDGGLPLLILYYGLIVMACLYAYRLAMIRRDDIGTLAVVVLAYNLATLANTFSYVPFIGQSGLYFWLLNACLMTVVLNDRSSMLRDLVQDEPEDEEFDDDELEEDLSDESLQARNSVERATKGDVHRHQTRLNGPRYSS